MSPQTFFHLGTHKLCWSCNGTAEDCICERLFQAEADQRAEWPLASKVILFVEEIAGEDLDVHSMDHDALWEWIEWAIKKARRTLGAP